MRSVLLEAPQSRRVWGALGEPLASPERAYTCLQMSDPGLKPDTIDEAIAQFWKPQTPDELMAGKKPFTSWDDLDIPDLTDDERDAFAAALADE